MQLLFLSVDYEILREEYQKKKGSFSYILQAINIKDFVCKHMRLNEKVTKLSIELNMPFIKNFANTAVIQWTA